MSDTAQVELRSGRVYAPASKSPGRRMVYPSPEFFRVRSPSRLDLVSLSRSSL